MWPGKEEKAASFHLNSTAEKRGKRKGGCLSPSPAAHMALDCAMSGRKKRGERKKKREEKKKSPGFPVHVDECGRMRQKRKGRRGKKKGEGGSCQSSKKKGDPAAFPPARKRGRGEGRGGEKEKASFFLLSLSLFSMTQQGGRGGGEKEEKGLVSFLSYLHRAIGEKEGRGEKREKKGRKVPAAC